MIDNIRSHSTDVIMIINNNDTSQLDKNETYIKWHKILETNFQIFLIYIN